MTWRNRGVCTTSPTPELWLSEDSVDEALAVAQCMTCPVRIECLEGALDEERGAGPSGRATVRGAKTPPQRYRLHHEGRKAREALRAGGRAS